jgi:hypothetical protein
VKFTERLKAVKPKTWLIGGGIVAALLMPLAGNGSTKAPEPSRSDPEQVYIAVVHSKYPSVPKARAIAVGHQVCRTLDAGQHVSDLAEYVAVRDLDTDTVAVAGWITGAAVSSLCPEYKYQLSR